MTPLAVALSLSLLVGVTLGLLGGGGSILTLPILTFVLGVEDKAAIATSLMVVSLTSAAALISHARAGNVDWRVGLTFAAAGSAGALGGGLLAQHVPGSWLIWGFLLMMVATGIAMLRGRQECAAARAPSTGKIVLDGAVVGLVTGLVGAGGGFLVVPALTLLGGLPMSRAVGTSLLVIAIKSVFGFAGHLSHVTIDWGLAASVSAAAVAGSFVGGAFVSKVPASSLRQAFGVFVLIMAVFLGWKQL